MILRDLSILQEASRRADVSVTFSVPTIDREVWARTEPGTAPPEQRLRVLKQLLEGGVRASVGMAPILPGISDRPEQLEAVVRAAREAGACGVWANVLYLRPGTREHFLEHLARDWPEELERYERLYAKGAYLKGAEATAIRGTVAELTGSATPCATGAGRDSSRRASRSSSSSRSKGASRAPARARRGAGDRGPARTNASTERLGTTSSTTASTSVAANPIPAAARRRAPVRPASGRARAASRSTRRVRAARAAPPAASPSPRTCCRR